FASLVGDPSMWPFKRSRPDASPQQAHSQPRRRWRLFILVTLAVLVGGLVGVFCVDRALWAGHESLTGTTLTHKKGNTTMTIEFGRLGRVVGSPVIRYATTDGSATGNGSITYTVVDDKSLSLAGGEKLMIDSISNDQLVLSGGPWKLDKT